MKEVIVYFICVNYNNSDYTELFLRSVANQKVNNADVRCVAVVVDNASDEADFFKLKKYCKEHDCHFLLRAKSNRGYFSGLNIGLSHIARRGNDLVVVGNNDLEFDCEFASRLVAAHYPEDVLVVAPNVITPDGYNQNPHCINRVGAFRKVLYRFYFTNYWMARVLTWGARVLKKVRGVRFNSQAHISQYIHMGIGACYVLLPSFFKNFSLLDDSVFLYGEEALLAGQVMSVNGHIYYDSDLIVRHAEMATLSKIPSRITYGFAAESYKKYKKYL